MQKFAHPLRGERGNTRLVRLAQQPMPVSQECGRSRKLHLRNSGSTFVAPSHHGVCRVEGLRVTSHPRCTDDGERKKIGAERRIDGYDTNATGTNFTCRSYSFFGGAERDRTADLLVANWLKHEI